MVIMQMFNGYGDLLYQFGMVDENEKAHIDNETQKGVNFMKQKDFYQAFLVKIYRQLNNFLLNEKFVYPNKKF